MQVTLDASTIIAGVASLVSILLGGYVTLFKFSFEQYKATIELRISSGLSASEETKKENAKVNAEIKALQKEINDLRLTQSVSEQRYSHIDKSLNELTHNIKQLNTKMDRYISKSSVPDSEG